MDQAVAGLEVAGYVAVPVGLRGLADGCFGGRAAVGGVEVAQEHGVVRAPREGAGVVGEPLGLVQPLVSVVRAQVGGQDHGLGAVDDHAGSGEAVVERAAGGHAPVARDGDRGGTVEQHQVVGAVADVAGDRGQRHHAQRVGQLVQAGPVVALPAGDLLEGQDVRRRVEAGEGVDLAEAAAFGAVGVDPAVVEVPGDVAGHQCCPSGSISSPRSRSKTVFSARACSDRRMRLAM